MTLAEIHGKSPLTGSEDFLTADVFTAFRYLPPGPGLIGFLRTIPGLGELLPRAERESAAIHFWPVGLHFNREPDLLIELSFDDSDRHNQPVAVVHVVVEAKYFSGPSDSDFEFQPGDTMINAGKQLVGEFLDLMHGHYRTFESSLRDRHLTLRSTPSDRHLLYLTAHPVRPDRELDTAVADHPAMAGRLFWANWYQAFEHFQNLRPVLTEFPYNRILADICTLLERKSFFTFHGFKAVPAVRTTAGHSVFWQDVYLGGGIFIGFARPPGIDSEPAAHIFWTPHQTGGSHG